MMEHTFIFFFISNGSVFYFYGHPGKSTSHFIESLDLYRTLVALAFGSSALPQIEPGVEGEDVSPVFASPTSSSHPTNKTGAYSQACALTLSDKLYFGTL